MTIEEFVLNLKNRLDNSKNNYPNSFANAVLSPYNECKQFKMKDLITEASKYGEDFILQKSIHFPTSDIQSHNRYVKQGGIIVYYKSEMKKDPTYIG